MKNHSLLGFNYHLEEKISSLLEGLNDSMKEELKRDKDLKAIKDIDFYLSENNDLRVKVTFRSNNSVDELFSSHVDRGAINLGQPEISAYFGEEKLNKVSKHLEGGALEAAYLEVHEPEVFLQLSKIYLLECSPNTFNGAEFTKSDKDFFLNLIKSNP